ncbi:MAG: sodium:proline symporter [Verrucomicrobia bacterium]|nr:sodium:proline symporter [Verrucomicrobiota bacterium]
MQSLDYWVMVVPLLFLSGLVVHTWRQLRSVADFMTGGRQAGPFLLSITTGGAVLFIATFEVVGKAGLTLSWWQLISTPIAIALALSGLVVYRFRETRAMTLAQFFELRYSKRFRVFTGILGFAAGLVNFGIIPAVGARGLVYFMGLPAEFPLLGHTFPTYIPVMAALLALTLFKTLTGGFLTVLITNCVGGMLCQLIYVVVLGVLLTLFTWPQISSVLLAQPAGQSLINPFDSLGLKDFNLGYIAMGAFLSIYGRGAWQNASAYQSAAVTPHASVMSDVLGNWRDIARMGVMTLLAVCALTFLRHPDFAVQAGNAHALIAAMPNAQIQSQMALPAAIGDFLPAGILGLFCLAMVLGVVGGDAIHLHSWGSIFVQDVLVSRRKIPFTPAQHIRALRLSMLGCAVFAFAFGVLFRQTEYIYMWWSVTTAIYVGGAGACVLGGLYWKKGTTAGAWAALLCGSLLSASGILARQIWGEAFPLNGTQISVCAALLSGTVYVVVSLLTARENYNLDRLLHRGIYADRTAQAAEIKSPQPLEVIKLKLLSLIGINKDFTRKDRWIAGGLFAWALVWFSVFVVVSLWNLVSPWSAGAWTEYWQVAGLGIPVALTVIITIGFTWGGVCDVRDFFKRLQLRSVNNLDNGTVVDGRNQDEPTGPESRG